jgi:hypothetical protein
MPGTVRSEAWVCGRSLAEIVGGFESRQWHQCLSLVSVVCCRQRSLSWADHSSRSPTECGVPEGDHEASMMRPWPTRGCCAIGRVGSAMDRLQKNF